MNMTLSPRIRVVFYKKHNICTFMSLFFWISDIYSSEKWDWGGGGGVLGMDWIELAQDMDGW
jgi:hypothetical protein